MNAAVFLDRDNTLIHNDGDLGDPAQVKLIMGAASAIASLKGLNFKIIVVSNQGGVARGKYGETDVVAVNDRINELIRANSGVAIDRFYFCPYHPEGIVERYRREHPWRKPRPGMLLQAAKDFQLDLRNCWMIGDQMRDVLAGYAAGAVPILIGDPGHPPAPTPAVPPGVSDERWLQNATATIRVDEDFFVARNLIEAVRLIGQQRRPTNVAAAMKAHREEVVPRSLPRVATAAFDPDSVQVVATEHPLIGRGEKAAEAATAIGVDEPEKPQSVGLAVTERHAKGEHAAGESMKSDSPEGRARSRGKDSGNEGSRGVPRPSRRKETESSAEHGLEMEATSIEERDALHGSGHVATDDTGADRHRPTRRPPGRGSSKPEPALDEKPRPSKAKAPMPAAGESPALQPASPPAPQAASSPDAPLTSAAATEQRRGAASAAAVTSVPQPKEAASSAETAGNTGASVEQTMRQILQELRNQRSLGGDFSFGLVMAIVMQMLAIVCLLAGLLMGGDNDGLFTRWAVCAVLLQLTTIAMLLFRR